MSNNNCGCSGSSKPTAREYMMIETTASEASQCTPSENESGVAGCPKQEPTFDSFQNGFIVPLDQYSVEVKVCNALIYSVGQWVETLGSPRVSMQISSINGSNLLLTNGCSNGAQVTDNPDAGIAINPGTRFSIVAEPPCETEEDQSELLNLALSTVTQLCVPDMVETTENAVVQFVGRVESNPDDTGFKKCIRRIRGLLMRGGTPVIPYIGAIELASILTHRKLGISKSNKEVREIPNHSEDTRLLNNEQYAISVSKTKETVVGPVYYPTFFHKLLKQVPTNIYDHVGTWLLMPTSGEYTEVFNLSFAEISSLLKERTHYYAMCRITISAGSAETWINVAAYLNDVLATQSHGFPDSSTYVYGKNSVSVPIRISTVDNSLKLFLKMNVASTHRVYLRLEIDGIYL